MFFTGSADRFFQMNAIPDHIPRSLRSYLDQYQGEPEKAITRLENHLEKRGPDAVGFYLLSWLYHHNNMPDKAVKAAWRAKIFAPGSPAMEKLHYYLSHPQKFDAWKPIEPSGNSSSAPKSRTRDHTIANLDNLIEKLSAVESSRIEFDPDAEEGEDLGKDSSQVDDIVTETLAKIHIRQGNVKDAIAVYRRLQELYPDRKERYEEEIRKLDNDDSKPKEEIRKLDSDDSKPKEEFRKLDSDDRKSEEGSP